MNVAFSSKGSRRPPPEPGPPKSARQSGGFDPLVGVLVDERYRLIERIGRGGSGAVYRAQQVNVDRELAVKVLRDEDAGEAAREARFEAEALALARLRHPATLKLIDFGHLPDGRPYLVSPLLQGRSLADLLAAEGPLAPPRVIALLTQALEALREAHDQGIVHRDLKPANLFVESISGREVVKILDFGVALLADRDLKLTDQGRAMGTVHYMSPEQVRGEVVDDRSDLYSLGVVAYECLAGEPPFDGPNGLTISMQHLEAEPPPLPGEVSRACQAWVRRCLSKLPDDRPETAEEALTALRQVATQPSMVPPAPARPSPWRALGLAAVAVSLAVGGWWLGRQTVPGVEFSARPGARRSASEQASAPPPAAAVPASQVIQAPSRMVRPASAAAVPVPAPATQPASAVVDTAAGPPEQPVSAAPTPTQRRARRRHPASRRPRSAAPTPPAGLY